MFYVYVCVGVHAYREMSILQLTKVITPFFLLISNSQETR